MSKLIILLIANMRVRASIWTVTLCILHILYNIHTGMFLHMRDRLEHFRFRQNILVYQFDSFPFRSDVTFPNRSNSVCGASFKIMLNYLRWLRFGVRQALVDFYDRRE